MGGGVIALLAATFVLGNLLARESRHDVAAVSHAGGIVFAAHVKGRAVVHRDHLWTWWSG